MRRWNSKDDSIELHCLSNGNVICYQRGPEIVSLRGPYYTMPSVLSALFCGELSAETERISGTMVYRHKLYINGQLIGEFVDFVAVNKNVFIRQFDLSKSLKLSLVFHESIENLSQNQYFLKSNLPYFADYVSLRPSYIQIDFNNASADGNTLTLNEGTGYVAFSFEPQRELLRDEPPDLAVLREETENLWRERCKDVFANLKIKDETRAEIYEDIFFLLMSQASSDGGGMAGSRYPLSYIRDQFGVSKGYMTFGLYDLMKKQLENYHDIFSEYGFLKNAQSMGYKGSFHEHENDEVEITGYIVLQARDYLLCTGDMQFIKKIIPMLKWAMERQAESLNNDMLPFNGDETYIAGGLLPRTVIDEGSSESTLLFIESCEWFSQILLVFGDKALSDKYEALGLRLKERYRELFFCGGELCANNPSRREGLKYKSSRNGVCLLCGSFKKLRLVKDGVFACGNCLEHLEGSSGESARVNKILSERLSETESRKVYKMPLLELMPQFIDSDLFSEDELKRICEKLKKKYENTGEIEEREYSVGYQYGLFLLSLVKTKDGFADVIFEKLLSLRAEGGGWAEYYHQGKSRNTTYRPWESAINLYAIDKYLRWRGKI